MPQDPAAYFANFGVAGLVVLALILGLLVAKPAHEETKQQLKATTDQRDALIETYQEQVIPILDLVANKVLPALESAGHDLRAAGVQFDGMRAELSDLKAEVRRQGEAKP